MVLWELPWRVGKWEGWEGKPAQYPHIFSYIMGILKHP